MIIYRVMVKTSGSGGMFMDGTHRMDWAIEQAQSIQAENPEFKVSVEAEEWKSLTLLKYRWYLLTGKSNGFGAEFQQEFSHRHSSTKIVWPET